MVPYDPMRSQGAFFMRKNGKTVELFRWPDQYMEGK
jgi:hypothetical protein